MVREVEAFADLASAYLHISQPCVSPCKMSATPTHLHNTSTYCKQQSPGGLAIASTIAMPWHTGLSVFGQQLLESRPGASWLGEQMLDATHLLPHISGLPTRHQLHNTW